LDGAKRPVDSLCSNVGHLLWSGIVPESRADAIVDSLMGADLWSGWGVRTMSAGDAAFNRSPTTTALSGPTTTRCVGVVSASPRVTSPQPQGYLGTGFGDRCRVHQGKSRRAREPLHRRNEEPSTRFAGKPPCERPSRDSAARHESSMVRNPP
jgi:hypothetical protein